MRKSLHLKKKTAVILTAGVLTVGTAAGAFAYWTTTGSGTGTATNNGSNGTVDLHASFAAGLTPGATEDVSFKADNNNTSSLYVGTITLASVTVDAPHSTCEVGDFTMPDVASATTVPASSTAFALAGTGHLTFADTAANQDPCKGAVITLHLTSN